MNKIANATLALLILTSCQENGVGQVKGSEPVNKNLTIVSSRSVLENKVKEMKFTQPVKAEVKKEFKNTVHKEVKVNKPVVKKPSIKKEINKTKINNNHISGRYEKIITAEVTAYFVSPAETGKSRNHPEYGFTASGTKAKVGRTIAMSRSYKFGTIVEMDGKLFRCEDRGGAIKGNKIDLLVKNSREAKQWGRRTIKVKIISTGDGKTHFKK